MKAQEAQYQELHRDYLAAVSGGNSGEAGDLIENALRRGLSPAQVYLQVLMPAQISVGELWHQGKLSISQEHLATQITYDQMARLRIAIRPRYKIGFKAVVAAISTDHHTIGSRVVADFLHMDGWDVEYLGPGTPGSEVVGQAGRSNANLVGISVTMNENREELQSTVNGLRALPQRPKVIVGGSGCCGEPGQALDNLQVDGIAANAEDARLLARRLMGLDGPQAMLFHYLKAVGSQVNHFRKLRNMSQSEVAERADLDRAYISSLENGKQNITIGALLKLADALDVSIAELIIDGHLPRR